MKIKEIKIDRLPGIRESFKLTGFDNGINLIVGHNGSGKSSIRRLVENILWPENRKKNLKNFAEIVVSDNEDELHAEISNTTVSWSAGGSPANPPAIPERHLRNCFFLDLKDLISETQLNDDEVACEIRKELSGFNFENLKEEFKVNAREGGDLLEKLRQAEQKLRDSNKKYSELAEDEKRIISLETKLSDAKKANSEKHTLQIILEAIEALERIEEVGEKLSTYPPAMNNLRENDKKQLDDFYKAIEEAEESVSNLKSEIAFSEETVSNLSIPDSPPSYEKLKACLSKAEELVRGQDKLETAERDAEAKKEALQSASKGMPLPPGTILEEEKISGIAKLAESYETAKRTLNETENAAEILQTQFNETGLNYDDAKRYADKLRDKSALLREWLAVPELYPETSSSAQQKFSSPIILAGALLAAAGIGMGLLISLWLFSLCGIGIGLIAGALIQYKLNKQPENSGSENDYLQKLRGEKEIIERNYNEIAEDDEHPLWERDSIRKYLKELDMAADSAGAEAESIHSISERFKEMNRICEVRRVKFTEIEEALQSELAAAGFTLPVSDLEIKIIGGRIIDLASAMSTSAEADKIYKIESAKFAELKEELNRFLEKNNRIASNDPRYILAEIQKLEREIKEYADAETALKEKSRTLEKEELRRDNLLTGCTEWLRERELPQESPQIELAGRLERLSEYNQLIEKKRDAESSLRIARGKLDADALKRLETTSQADIETEIREKEILSDDYENILKELEEIKLRIKAAGESFERGTVNAELESRKGELHDTCDNVLHRLSALFMLSEAEEEYRKNNQPEVISRASAYFNEFTAGMYELQLTSASDDADLFTARHTSENRHYRINELSDGTRIQLLLALKVAFADQADNHSSLPLILDEPLTTSDPLRFRTVAKALMTIAKKRQIIYLSSDPADIAKWNKAAEAEGVRAPELFDIGELRFSAGASSDIEDFISTPIPEYPEPDITQSPESYAVKLGVPPLSLAEPVSSWHIFYAVHPDVELCYKILSEYRIVTIGQWQAVSAPHNRGGAVRKSIGQEVSAAIDAKIALLNSLRSSLFVGRGKRFTPADVADCPYISDKFQAKFTELTEELNGDAEKIVQIFSSKTPNEHTRGFRKKEELAEYFEDNGFIDTRPPLSDAEVIAAAERDCITMIETGLLTNSDIRTTLDRIK
jgi:uncharacterized protein YhaN